MPRKKKEAPNRSDGRYEVKITIGRDIDGKLIRKSFFSNISKEDAKAKADMYKNAVAISNYLGIGITTKTVTFEQWATEWLLKYKKGTVKESTYTESYERTVQSYLIPSFGKRNISDIIPADIRQFLTDMSQKYSSSTLKKIKLCLNAIFETAIENNLCYKNPAKNISIASKRENNKKRTYDEQTVEKIIDFASTHKNGLYIQILLELGVRCSELLGLKWSDFDFENKVVVIQRAITAVNHKPRIDVPKSKTSIRTIPISTRLARAIAEHKNDNSEFVVQQCPITPANFTKNVYNPFFRDLNKQYPDIYRLSPHELRHTCGTLLYNKTKDLYAVSKFLGHANVGITAKLYVHEDVEVLRKSLGIA